VSTTIDTAPRRSLSQQSLGTVWRKALNLVMLSLAGAATLVAVGALLAVLIYLTIQGIGSLHPAIFTQGPTPQGIPGGGLRNGIIGSAILLGVASAIGLPIGILGALYQIESKGRLAWTVRFFTDVLNSIPSIVIGLFVYAFVVVPAGYFHGFSALAGSIALGIIMIPTVMRTTEEILRLVPTAMRDASLALGATRWRTMWSVTLPAARAGILTGVMLALARIAGETAPLLFTAFGNSLLSMRLNQPIDALPLDIYIDATSPYPYLHRQAEAGAILLVAFILALSLITRFVLRARVQE